MLHSRCTLLFDDSSGLLLLVPLQLRIVLEEAGSNKSCVLPLMFIGVARVSLPPPTKLRTKALRKILVPRAPYEAILLSKARDWTDKHSRIKEGSDADGGIVQ